MVEAGVGYDALTRCVGDPHVFAAETWGMRPLLQAAGRDEGFDDLLSLDDVDRLVSSTGLRLPAFRLVKEGKTIPADNYTKTTRTGSQIASGVLDAPAVFREFDDGATIVFQGMHRYWEPPCFAGSSSGGWVTPFRPMPT